MPTTRPRRDLDDLDNLFDRDEALERRREREAAKAYAIERSALMEAQDKALRDRARAATADTARMMILRDYEHHGLTPPRGALCSLPMQQGLGWKIETMADGEKQLVAPQTPEPYRGRRDADSLPENI